MHYFLSWRSGNNCWNRRYFAACLVGRVVRQWWQNHNILNFIHLMVTLKTGYINWGFGFIF